MFKRRNKVTFAKKMRNSIWPESGWKRAWQYLSVRLYRLKGTPYSLAAGIACGAAISFTPFVGFHFVLAALTALVVRGSIIASALGTAVGNPWTFPFIWVSVLYTGRHMLKADGVNDVPIDFTTFFEKAMHAIINLDFHLFFEDIWPILWPMMVGCIPYYIVVWLVSYFTVRHMLDKINDKYKSKTKG